MREDVILLNTEGAADSGRGTLSACVEVGFLGSVNVPLEGVEI